MECAEPSWLALRNELKTSGIFFDTYIIEFFCFISMTFLKLEYKFDYLIEWKLNSTWTLTPLTCIKIEFISKNSILVFQSLKIARFSYFFQYELSKNLYEPSQAELKGLQLELNPSWAYSPLPNKRVYTFIIIETFFQSTHSY